MEKSPWGTQNSANSGVGSGSGDHGGKRKFWNLREDVEVESSDESEVDIIPCAAETLPSEIDQQALASLVKQYRFDPTVKVKMRVPLPCERACWPSNDEVAFYSVLFKNGVRLPLHDFFKDVAANYGISPAQITPKGYTHMMGMLLLWHDLNFGVPCMLEWNSIYRIAQSPASPGYYYFNRWSGKGFGLLILDSSSPPKKWKSNWFWLTTGEASQESSARTFKKARYTGSRHEAKGLLLERIDKAFRIHAEKRRFEVLRAGRTVSAIKMPRPNPLSLRLTDIKAKANIANANANGNNVEPLDSHSDARKKLKVSTPSLLTKQSVPVTPLVDVGNMEAAELETLVTQATMALSCARAKLGAEVATLRSEMEKGRKEKNEAKEKLEASEVKRKSLKDTIASLKSELENRDKTITDLQNEVDAARRGEGLDLKKIAESQLFQPIRTAMEIEIAQGLIGMIEERDPNFDSSFLYGANETTDSAPKAEPE